MDTDVRRTPAKSTGVWLPRVHVEVPATPTEPQTELEPEQRMPVEV
jgi:hypothetical protein